MSKFAARMVAGLSPHYERTGDSATYTDPDSAVTPCTVIVEHDISEYGEVATVTAGSVVIRVRRTELDARPVRDTTFTVGSTIFRVEQVLQSDEFEHWVLAA